MELKYNYLEQIFKGVPMNAHTIRLFRTLAWCCEDRPTVIRYGPGFQQVYESKYPNFAGHFEFRGKDYIVLNNDDGQCYEIFDEKKNLTIQAEPWNTSPGITFITQLLDLELLEKGENHVF